MSDKWAVQREQLEKGLALGPTPFFAWLKRRRRVRHHADNHPGAAPHVGSGRGQGLRSLLRGDGVQTGAHEPGLYPTWGKLYI